MEIDHVQHRLHGPTRWRRGGRAHLRPCSTLQVRLHGSNHIASVTAMDKHLSEVAVSRCGSTDCGSDGAGRGERSRSNSGMAGGRQAEQAGLDAVGLPIVRPEPSSTRDSRERGASTTRRRWSASCGTRDDRGHRGCCAAGREILTPGRGVRLSGEVPAGRCTRVLPVESAQATGRVRGSPARASCIQARRVQPHRPSPGRDRPFLVPGVHLGITSRACRRRRWAMGIDFPGPCDRICRAARRGAVAERRQDLPQRVTESAPLRPFPLPWSS